MAATPGLAGNIRQLPQDELDAMDPATIIPGEDVEQVDESGGVFRIEHDDGSVTISIDDKPIFAVNDDKPSGWFENLAEKIDPGQLTAIAEDLVVGIDEDISSREEWITDRATGIKLLGLKLEVPGQGGSSDGAPVEGMSRIRHPLLLEAVLRFQANARSELLPTDGPVKIRNDDNNATLAEDQQANALQRDLNHYLTTTASEYYPDTDRMLLLLGFGGTTFKKVYFCPLRGRPVSETVDADDLIVNNSATDMVNARRITHRVFMRPSTVKRMQILGVYRDIDLGDPKPVTQDAAKRAKDEQQGVTDGTMRPGDRDREIYECYCELDIPGFEHKYKGKASGLEIPYRVTIDLSTRQVLSIVRNYDEDGEDLPEARKTFVKYTFVPGLGFYDIGLLHILGNTTNAITAAWREMLDAGMFANFPGFLIADSGLRQNTNIFRVPPGGGAPVKTGGLPINQAVMPLPYKEPGPAMMGLVQNMAETGQRVGGTSELAVGEGRSDAPVGTTLALIDQATKVLNSVHKRMHAAQVEEFRLIVDCFRENPKSFWQRNRKPATQWDEETFLAALDNFELVPQADPNTASQTQRMMKIVGLKELQKNNPTMYDPIAIDTAAMQAMGWSNPQQFMVPSNAMGRPTPEMMEKEAKIKIEQQKADATTMLAQATAAEKMQGLNGAEGAAPPDPMKMAELQIKQGDQEFQMAQLRQREQEQATELQMHQSELPLRQQEINAQIADINARQRDSELDAINRLRDRESRERVAAVGLAKDAAKTPQALGIINKVVGADMVDRLESNEQPLRMGRASGGAVTDSRLVDVMEKLSDALGAEKEFVRGADKKIVGVRNKKKETE